MLKIGLTGGIGSGKSYVAEVFRHLAVPVFNSDDEARRIQETDQEVLKQIRDAFGDVFLADGKLDRKKVASIVFSDAQKLQQLNAIVHPAVGRAFDAFCAQHRSKPYVLKEAAIIFEAGIDEHLDSTILVTSKEKTRIERVMKRDSVSESEVRTRISKQWSDEDKKQRADYLIDNDGEKAILPQVLKIHNVLLNS
jgi:dephospho-CoA kinase